MKIWKKQTQEEIKERVFDALEHNVNYDGKGPLGVPASYLDTDVFNQDAAFLKEAPFLYSLVKNPNHIGCHTLGNSESFFKGTQEIERELIELCAVDILHGKPGEQDGYVASGGTEANIQAIWIYRNFFIKQRWAHLNDLVILCSEDSHYSMDKAANLLGIGIEKVTVDDERKLLESAVRQSIKKAQGEGKKHFIVVSNMMTTMFGSVDDVNIYTRVLEEEDVDYKLHVDGAYGGFYYPFTHEDQELSFANPRIDSFTLDAHKMAQSPYGTGIFLIRKGLISYANTKEASYVEGEDYTLIGSRSGANAIAVWMILSKHGPYGWHEKVFILQKRSQWLCDQLNSLGIKHYRHPNSNIITINANQVPDAVAEEFGLVPDNHEQPRWRKVVVMDHVTIEKLEALLHRLR
jgi:glutamate/tyrosine decarboxylase-like PLP-dependent enzyme